MSFYENLREFAGQPVVDWTEGGSAIDLSKCAIGLRLDYDESSEGVTLAGKLASFLEQPNCSQLCSIVIGAWQPDDTGMDSSAIVEALVAARGRLTSLRNIFIGDMISEECEISWIRQSDMSALLAGYPELERLVIRGAEGLTFGSPRHDRLKELIIQCGGLPPTVVHEIGAAQFPSLEKLELYLGEPNYGGEATVEDLAPLLHAGLFPKLRYLGLKDSIIQDEIAGVISQAPVLSQLEVLDLSLGSLGDEGARALLASPAIRKLKKLDLHHHYISDELVKQLNGLGIEVDLSDKTEPDDWGDGTQHRYIAVSE